ncbi:IS1380 family transposase [Levilactobacillus cerevisiae]|uniref:IS1380 family transposase n=3 Tax=Levilactobacillus cerevisiae TaxID=1704076 RepID=UPI00345E7265
MTNILDHGLDFNSKISFCDDGTQLTNDAGLFLTTEFLQKIDFDKMIKSFLPQIDSRCRPKHGFSELLTQLLLQKIAGYQNDSMITALTKDVALKLCLGTDQLASQPTISRFINRLDQTATDGFSRLNLALNRRLIAQSNQSDMVLDVDSTHCDTFGNQVESAYNPHYASMGLHPLIAFNGLTGMLLGAKLRPGNVYTSNGVAAFLDPIIAFIAKANPRMNLLVRGDSGFATPELYQLCLDTKTKFLIKLKSNSRLSALAMKCVEGLRSDDFCEHYFTLDYQAEHWSEDWHLRVVLKASRSVDDLFWHFEYLVTTLKDVTIIDLFRAYHKRGIAENFIKEAKEGFGFDKTNSHSFQANNVRMWLAVLSYTLTLMFKQLVLSSSMQSKTIGTLRFQLFHIAGRVTTHAHKIVVHLSRSNPFIQLFWFSLHRIHQLD